MKHEFKKLLGKFLTEKIKEFSNQAEAAKVLKVSQPRVSYLTTGRLDTFSVDSLVSLLHNLGYKMNHHIADGMIMITFVPTGENNAS